MNRKLNYIWSAFFLAELGRVMYFILITWILYSLTENAFYTGLLVSLGFLPGLLMNLWFGVIVDRLNRKALSVVANLISTLTILMVLFAIWFDVLTPWVIILAQMIIQLMGSLFRPAIQAFIAEIFPTADLPKVYSQSGSAAIMGGLLGASLGGIAIGVFSEFITMSIVVVSFILATVFLYLIPKTELLQKEEKNSERKSVVKDLLEGFTYLKSNAFLFSLFGTMFVGQLVFHSSITFLSVYTKDYLSQTVTVYGFLDATLSLGGVIAGILGTWWWNKSSNYLSTNSLVVVFAGLCLVGFSTNLYIAFIGVFLIGLGTTWIRILIQSIQQMATDKAYHGRMASYRMLCNQGSVVISGPILGWIATYGANSVYISLLIPVGLGALLCLKQATQEKFKKITERPV